MTENDGQAKALKEISERLGRVEDVMRRDNAGRLTRMDVREAVEYALDEQMGRRRNDWFGNLAAGIAVTLGAVIALTLTALVVSLSVAKIIETVGG